MAEDEATTTTTTAAETTETTEGEAESKPEVPNIAQPEKHWFWGLGRRKRSVARVRIKPGEGKFLINKREIKDYFPSQRDRQQIVAPLEATETSKVVDVFVNVYGGGTTGEAGDIML